MLFGETFQRGKVFARRIVEEHQELAALGQFDGQADGLHRGGGLVGDLPAVEQFEIAFQFAFLLAGIERALVCGMAFRALRPRIAWR